MRCTPPPHKSAARPLRAPVRPRGAHFGILGPSRKPATQRNLQGVRGPQIAGRMAAHQGTPSILWSTPSTIWRTPSTQHTCSGPVRTTEATPPSPDQGYGHPTGSAVPATPHCTDYPLAYLRPDLHHELGHARGCVLVLDEGPAKAGAGVAWEGARG